MALYSAKEAKWYRCNVERCEHCQFNCLQFSSEVPRSFILNVLSVLRSFISTIVHCLQDRSLNSKKVEFLFIPSTRPSSIDSLPKVRFNYITCCSCQETRGYKTYESGGGCAYQDYRKYGVDHAA